MSACAGPTVREAPATIAATRRTLFIAFSLFLSLTPTHLARLAAAIAACERDHRPRRAPRTAVVMTPVIERSFVPISCGPVDIAACGAGRPILLLHQTPRSWDESRALLPRGLDSIEAWAEAAHQVLAALGHERATVLGHHTGAAIAIEMAASRPD